MTSRALGKQGERTFRAQMEARGYKVEDVSDNSNFWDKDIDFIVTSPTTGAVKSFEVKWDTRINSTGNLYLEMVSIYSKGGKGWFEFCEADYVAYGDSHTETFYIIPLASLKQRVKELPERIGNCSYESAGYLVSLKDIEDLYKIL